MYDELDFVCPTFEEWEDSSQFEYYIIYQVSVTNITVFMF